ncbi:MAG: 2,5-diketo-D-gluconic acid reductase [Spirochaetae bacterium HGW-Spirochaetae-3]|jgi:diketogulonate reductase-like aldo/keto reductase|nr:MAG: 2,5-diketo-D-gluconic acid reductase [Spirochaetae bacterium HGW-Spirochaetae-3]
MEFVKLNNGVGMPALGFGVFQISDMGQCERSVAAAVDIGYRLIDTAASYGNEEAVGRALASSGVDRSELFVTTKVWVQDVGYEKTRKAFGKSLENLRLDYLDLYLIHQPYGDIFGAWRAMEELYREGKVRAIGVSNFPDYRLMDLIVNSEIKPAVNQVETHPFNQQLRSAEFLKQNDIQIESWGPFAEGRNNLFANDTLVSIAAAHGKSVAQVVLRWLIQRGVVAIPKSVNPDRMEQNFNVFDFCLTDAEMEAVKSLDTSASLFFSHQDPEMVKLLCTRRLD